MLVSQAFGSEERRRLPALKKEEFWGRIPEKCHKIYHKILVSSEVMISYDHRKTNRIPILKKIAAHRSSIIGSSLMFTFCDMVVGVVE